MTTLTLAVFAATYLGMILGGLPGMALDRTGVALLGAFVLIAGGAMDVEEAARAVDLPTLILLFAFMVVSAQMRLAGFYDTLTRRLASLQVTPSALIAALVLVAGGLSAVFSNDVVCLAMAPVLIDACRERGLAPVPFLLALACAANLGSALTLIGNPQNMLIGQALHLSFTGYLGEAAPPVLAGLVLTWLVVRWRTKGELAEGDEASDDERAARTRDAEVDAVPLDRWQAGKGLAVAVGIVGCFLFGPWPREVVALAGAALLMASRQMRSRDLLQQVDWNLLLLFIGLFIVNHALARTGMPARAVHDLAEAGVALQRFVPLATTTFVLSNIVSNVPAVMLLLPLSGGSSAGPTLALVSTLAGNLFLVGSVANLIVADAAAKHRIDIDWRTHARVGVPVTVSTLAVAAAWLALR